MRSSSVNQKKESSVRRTRLNQFQKRKKLKLLKK